MGGLDGGVDGGWGWFGFGLDGVGWIRGVDGGGGLMLDGRRRRHNIGLGHASSDFGDTGENVDEYGDASDVMGSANGVVRFNFPHSMLLGYATGSSDGVPDCDGSGLPDGVTISALHVNDVGAVHGLLVDRVPSDAESAARETYCSSAPCPADRDHLTVLVMGDASELVAVRYAISYRGSAGIDGNLAPRATPGEERRVGEGSVGIGGRSAPGATREPDTTKTEHRSAPGATPRLDKDGEESLSGRSAPGATPEPDKDGGRRSAPGATREPDTNKNGRPSAPGATLGEESLSGRSAGISVRSAPGATPGRVALARTSASTGTVYVHAYSDPGSGTADNSRLVAVLAGPGSTWTSTTTNLTVTVVSGNASAVALRVCAPDAPHDGVATSAGAVLGAWSIAFISIGAVLLVSVACLASSGPSSPIGYVQLDEPESWTGKSMRLGQRDDGRM